MLMTLSSTLSHTWFSSIPLCSEREQFIFTPPPHVPYTTTQCEQGSHVSWRLGQTIEGFYDMQPPYFTISIELELKNLYILIEFELIS